MCFGSGARKSVAAMVFHHAIADGRSGADVLIEVLRRAGGEELPLSFRPAQPSAQALDLIKLGGPVGASIRTFGYWLQQGRSALKLARQLPGFDMAVRAERRIRVVPFTVPKAKARALLEACRAHGVTMQGALGAAQLLAINDEFGSARPRNLGLNSLADLRGLLGGQPDAAGPGPVHRHGQHGARHPRRAGLLALAADVRNQLKAVLDSGDANLVHSIHREGALYPPNEVGARMVQGLVGLAPPSSMLTNVGRFDPVALADGAKLARTGLPGVAAGPASDLRHGVEPGRRPAPESAVRPVQDRCRAGAALGRCDGRAPRTGGRRLAAAAARRRRYRSPQPTLPDDTCCSKSPTCASRCTPRAARPMRCAACRFSMQRGDTRRADRRIGLRQERSPRWR